jgi:hypothetical protein
LRPSEAAIGLYGLLAYSVARRTKEIGIRMALGATTGDVSRLVLRDAVGMLCAGFVLAGFMVLWGRPLAASLVQGLKPEGSGPLALAAAPLQPLRCWPRMCQRGMQLAWTRWQRCATSSRARMRSFNPT